jgi:hypothetical protein
MVIRVRATNQSIFSKVGENEIRDFYNFLSLFKLCYNSLFPVKSQSLFGFICFWKIRVFLLQVGTNLAQDYFRI